MKRLMIAASLVALASAVHAQGMGQGSPGEVKGGRGHRGANDFKKEDMRPKVDEKAYQQTIDYHNWLVRQYNGWLAARKLKYAEYSVEIDSVNDMVRRYNGAAPIFISRVIPREWMDLESAASRPQDFRKVAAFCGLGTPRSFWRSAQTPLPPMSTASSPNPTHQSTPPSIIPSLRSTARLARCRGSQRRSAF